MAAHTSAMFSVVLLVFLFYMCQPSDAATTRERRICYLCDLERTNNLNCTSNSQCFDGTWCLTVKSGNRLMLRGCSWTNPVGDNKCYHALNGEQWCYCGTDLCNNEGMVDKWAYGTASMRGSSSAVIPIILLVLFTYRLLWRL